MELEDLVYTYPKSNIPQFQTLISAKKEFKEVGSSAIEPVPKRGELFNHQKYLLRLMRQYDNQFIVWSTGTGKTCGVVGVTEYYKTLASTLEEYRQKASYQRAYVLVKGQSLEREFKNQLLCKCTDGDYITPQIINSKKESQRQINITNSIKKFYTITTYEKFAKGLLEQTDSQLQETYSNSIFIIDEVHNIKYKPIGKERINKVGNKYHVKVKDGQEKIIKHRVNYDQLWRLFHTITPRKVLLLSATPMINEASEIGPRLNLILPKPNQIPFNTNFKTITLDKLKPYLNGLISYVRELDTGVTIEYKGNRLKKSYKIGNKTIESEMVVYATEMRKLQKDTYKIAKYNPKKLNPIAERSEAFSDIERQASNFVFPDGSTGSKGYNNKKYIINENSTPYFHNYLKNPDNLKQSSFKFYSVVKLCKDNPGNCWCYTHLKVGSGGVLLGLCFEANGFEKFNAVKSIFGSEVESGLGPVCSENYTGDRVIKIKKGLRYAVLTSTMTSTESDNLLEAFNSYENRYGEYIKVIIGTPVTRDGINLSNVLQIHTIAPGWNQASTYQAESRAIRSTSHVDLLSEERERLKKLGKNPDDARVDIKIYRHASVIKDIVTVDLQMYQLSEEKDIEIKRILRMMKQSATDCQIHYNRNVRSGDVDYSSKCDYDICHYKCIDPDPEYTDYTSYDVLYSNNIVNDIKMNIIELYKTYFSLSYQDIYSLLESYKIKFINIAIRDIIENKISITDRYGNVGYMREDMGFLFLRKEYPITIEESKGSYALSEYTESIIGVSKLSIKEYLSGLQDVGQTQQISEIFQMDPGEELDELLSKLSLKTQALILEKAISLNVIDNISSPNIDFILNKYKNFIYQVEEPVTSLQIALTALANRGKGRGRKTKVTTKFKLNKTQELNVIENINADKNQEIIYMHTLYSQKDEGTSYSVVAKSGKSKGNIRYLKISENMGWRDVNEYEDAVYSTIIFLQFENKRKEFEDKYDIYGTLLSSDNKFRIRDKTTEKESMAKIDKRTINRGQICITWKKPELIEVLWKLKYNPFSIKIDLTDKQIMNYLLDSHKIDKKVSKTFSRKKLEFYYTWYNSGMNRELLCNKIQKYFEDNNMLFKM